MRLRSLDECDADVGGAPPFAAVREHAPKGFASRGATGARAEPAARRRASERCKRQQLFELAHAGGDAAATAERSQKQCAPAL